MNTYIQVPAKECYVCKVIKPLSDFNNHKYSLDGKRGDCRDCQKIYRKEYSLRKRSESRSSDLKRRFNITVDDYDKLEQSQNGVCAICGKPETKLHHITGKVRRLCIDHSHLTGKVRGLLCTKCNQGLGSFMEDKKILTNAIDYLEYNNE